MRTLGTVALSVTLLVASAQLALASRAVGEEARLGDEIGTLIAQDTDTAACLIGNHSGVSDSDAETAASLVCDELRNLGVQVGYPTTEVPSGQAAYRVNLSLMGNTYVFDLAYEDPVGQVQDRRRLRLETLDAVLDEAGRIADALVNNRPLDESGAEVVQPTEPTPTPEPTQPQYTGGIACLIGEHGGLPDSDARTAASLVCDELRQLGVAVGQPVTDATGAPQAYRVSTQRLGRIIMFEVAYESPAGSVVDSRRLQLANIEEVPVAAPRLADALVYGVPIEETADVESLVGEETREPGQLPGDTYWGIGIAGLTMPGTDIFGAPGVIFKFFYEATQYSVGSDILFAGGSPSGDDDGLFFSWSVGGRYFFNRGNTGFFAGGGFAWDTIYASRGPDPENRPDGIGTGVGFYGEGGVEFFRMYGSRLMVTLRIDVPFFSVEEELKDEEDVVVMTDKNYVFPISLSVAYAW